MIDEVVTFLACPVCLPRSEEPLRRDARSLGCARGHRFDIARQGYVNLVVGDGRRMRENADDADMVQARAAFLEAGFYRPLTDAIAALVDPRTRGGILDIGAGTGHHLAAVLDACEAEAGIAVDLSTHAARRAARIHRRVGAVVADVWRGLPIRRDTVDVVLDIFSPRNAAEFARVLRPGGQLIVATPTPGHLAEIVDPLGLLSVDRRKEARLTEALEPYFRPEDTRLCEFEIELSRSDAELAVAMGPSARHIPRDELRRRLDDLPSPLRGTVSVRLASYR